MALAYFPALKAGYIWDDEDYVTGNATLRSLPGLAAIWLEPRSTPQYYPLVHTSFWLEYRLWGLHPTGYHAVNVVLHAANALMLGLLLARLGVPGAMLAAVVYAFHPLQVESVAWITERKNVLSTFFYLTAAWQYLKWCGVIPQQGSMRPANAGLWLAHGFYMAALLSKSVTCSLPAALLVVLWWKKGRVTWRDAVPLLPMFVLGGLYGALTIWLERTHVGAEGTAWDLTPLQHLILAARILWFYAGKLVWPEPLIFIYPRWEISTGDALGWLALAAALALPVMLYVMRQRIGRAPLAAVLLYAGTLFPALGFINVYPMRFSWVADHFSYLAIIGLVALLCAGLARLSRRFRSPEHWLAMVLVLPLGALTFRQAGDYWDIETLWRANIRKAPEAWMPYSNLGHFLAKEGREAEAITLFEKAVELNPDYHEALYNLGTSYLRAERYPEAERLLRKAVALRPAYWEAHLNLGNLLLLTGRPNEAISAFEQALAHGTSTPALAWLGIGQARGKLGDVSEALAAFSKASEADPENLAAKFYAAQLLRRSGKPAQAIGTLRDLLKRAPGNLQVRVALADCSIAIGRPQDAYDVLKSAVEKLGGATPPEVVNKLGLAKQRLGDHAGAVQYFRQTLAAAPDNEEAMNNLAWLLATSAADSIRNGNEALDLASRLTRGSGGTNPYYLDTLAAAHAELGDFTNARKILQTAVQHVPPSETSLRSEIKEREAEYDIGLPWREAK